MSLGLIHLFWCFIMFIFDLGWRLLWNLVNT